MEEIESGAQGAESPSIDDTLNTAYAEIMNRGAEQETEQQDKDSGRDEHGRFKAREAAETVEAQPSEADQQPEQKPAKRMPVSYRKEIEQHWGSLPQEVQDEILRRESDFEKGFSEKAQDAKYGATLRQIITPYEAMIRAEGGTPEEAVQSLLNTAYQLRTASPTQRQQLFLGLAQQYGVDVSQLATQAQQPIDPRYAAVERELNDLRSYVSSQQQSQQQALASEATSQIEKFAADPANKHFSTVRQQMGALINAGQATDLRQAYEMACWSNPEIRAQLIAEQDAKRAEDAKKAAAEAKKAASPNVQAKGAPKPGATKGATIDETLRARFKELTGG